MSASVELKGLKELEERLLLVGKVAGAKAMRQSLFAATKPILDQAKSNIRSWPGGSGALHAAMGRTFRASKGGSVLSNPKSGPLSGSGISLSGGGEGGRFTIQVGPRLRVPSAVALHNLFYKRVRKNIYYGHLLEFGHRIGTRTSGRLSRGTYVPVVTYLTRLGKSVTRAGRGAAGQARAGGVSAGSVPPQRFLRPALDNTSLRAAFVFQTQLKKRIDRALKKQSPEERDA